MRQRFFQFFCTLHYCFLHNKHVSSNRLILVYYAMKMLAWCLRASSSTWEVVSTANTQPDGQTLYCVTCRTALHASNGVWLHANNRRAECGPENRPMFAPLKRNSAFSMEGVVVHTFKVVDLPLTRPGWHLVDASRVSSDGSMLDGVCRVVVSAMPGDFRFRDEHGRIFQGRLVRAVDETVGLGRPIVYCAKVGPVNPLSSGAWDAATRDDLAHLDVVAFAHNAMHREVEALAGTGKTHMLESLIARCAVERVPVLYVVFNKSMQQDALRRIEQCNEETCRTFDSLCYYLNVRASFFHQKKNLIVEVGIHKKLTCGSGCRRRSSYHGRGTDPWR